VACSAPTLPSRQLHQGEHARQVPHPRLLRLLLAGGASQIPEGATLVRSSEPITADSAELRLQVQLPPRYHLTKGANSRFEASVVGDAAGAAAVQVSPGKGALQEEAGGACAAVLQVKRQPGSSGGGTAGGQLTVVQVLCKVYFCQDNDVCLFEEVVFQVPLGAGGAAQQQVVELSHAVSSAAPQISLPGL
jgi:hypothetical protein